MERRTFIQAYDRTLQEWEVPVESKYLDTSFGKTHVLISGPEDAEPLILLHGFGFSSTMWIENVKPLSERYCIYAVDFIGDINKSEAIWHRFKTKKNVQVGETHIIVSGSIVAPALILFHGMTFSTTMWYPNIESLSRHFRINAVDTIGDFGKAPLHLY
ncbi:hypothetical protein HQN89_26925 [Paenibacillus frigoriresistens]|uniref:alpha/beta fold hydrolase n=1 Tax=Paenibacillus alginolyticus TaxID=59839 RepID=UPI001564D38C|nr:hypothetical protein [Paenibacillus frigoriresistens]NRF94544.1 hypothetical protein [Paenibacillus frigoriresistens]